MNLLYKNTRNAKDSLSASKAIIQGLSAEGGLYVPEQIPTLDIPLSTLQDMTYAQVAYAVMKQFFTDFTKEELQDCINKAYDDKFDTKEIVPIQKIDGAYYLELFHGPTIAFKDMALSILPHLLTTAAKKHGITNEIVILAATSGDTGKAALAGFADVPGTKIIVFYPKSGVSKIQELQMVTQTGKNTSVVAIHGNFDDAQSGVKAIFEDTKLQEKMAESGYQFSSANSINIGRLVPQIVYYVYAYGQLLKNGEIKEGEEINVVVPTGNFGNILAAYYARGMGLPIRKLICASNENKVLFDFFETGVYDRNREFILTASPSMDILISSNLERLIYEIVGANAEDNAQKMKELKETGAYEITEEMKQKLAMFVGGYATEEQVANEIRKIYETTSYVMDTHTAVAANVFREYRERTQDKTKTVLASTASPYKFAKHVLSALDTKYENIEEMETLAFIPEISGVEMPSAVRDILDATILHSCECDVSDMKRTVEKILGIDK